MDAVDTIAARRAPHPHRLGPNPPASDFQSPSIFRYDLSPNRTESIMAPEPAIVTAGWPEVSGCLARTGIFQEDQLNPETAPRILGDLVRRYTTIIGYGVDGQLTPIGSGTLSEEPMASMAF